MDWFVLQPSKESQCVTVWFSFTIVNVAVCYQISKAPQMVRCSLQGECFEWMCFLCLKAAIKALNQQERTPKFSLCSANAFKVPVCMCLIKTFCLNYLIIQISHKGEIELYCNCTVTIKTVMIVLFTCSWKSWFNQIFQSCFNRYSDHISGS